MFNTFLQSNHSWRTTSRLLASINYTWKCTNLGDVFLLTSWIKKNFLWMEGRVTLMQSKFCIQDLHAFTTKFSIEFRRRSRQKKKTNIFLWENVQVLFVVLHMSDTRLCGLLYSGRLQLTKSSLKYHWKFTKSPYFSYIFFELYNTIHHFFQM